MADKQKTLGKTVLSWFVVRDEDGSREAAAPPSGQAPGQAADTAIDDLIARYAGDGTARPQKQQQPGSPPDPVSVMDTLPGQPSPAAGAPPLPPGSQVAPANLDLPAILRQHGVSPDEQGRVERALSLLHTLPGETPKETKRQIVAAALLAFGIQVDSILEAALLHLRALELHVADGQKKTQALLAESTAHLQELEREAEQVRKIMQDQQIAQQALDLGCTGQKQKVQEILEFFGQEAVERVSQAAQASGRLRKT